MEEAALLQDLVWASPGSAAITGKIPGAVIRLQQCSQEGTIIQETVQVPHPPGAAKHDY